jgi:hypothetical protein
VRVAVEGGCDFWQPRVGLGDAVLDAVSPVPLGERGDWVCLLSWGSGVVSVVCG